MFKVDKIHIYNPNNKEYIYNFSNGINYFVGSNNTGKTEFYKFIDFMFGASSDIRKNDWNNGSLTKVVMEIDYNDKHYWLTRSEHPEENYFKIQGDEETESIGLAEYKEKLNEIFSVNEVSIRKLREFTGENLTYRTFTMFNFLGEEGQGLTRDFLDKCRSIKYSVKLAPILNYVFNDNVERIEELKKKIENLREQIKGLEIQYSRYSFNQQQINNNLLKLNINIVFNGHNGSEIRMEILKVMGMDDVKKEKDRKSISELEVIYSNITEQIKIYESTISNYQQSAKENENRKKLLNNLESMIENEAYLEYLAKPLLNMMDELNNSISFSKYIISDETIGELKKQRIIIKNEMNRQDAKFKCFSLEDKSKAIALIQAYLDEDARDVQADLNELKKKLKVLKSDLQELQMSDNSSKISSFSKLITRLYSSGKDCSDIIKLDTARKGFAIEYIKRGNILQPVKDDNDDKITENNNLCLGSMARHTLIQLSGYFAFLCRFIDEKKYPFIPIMVLDHISKSFSTDNKKAVGKILDEFLSIVSKDNVQIFIFDDKEPEELGIVPDHTEYLKNKVKSGFNPFYISETNI